MKTLEHFVAGLESIPTAVAWYLEEIAESRGRQELFLRQSPQVLQALREHALIESAVSSNRIEGVEVEQARVATLVFGQPAPRDRNEEELRGYRNALNLIHTRAESLPIIENTVRELHRLYRGEAADGGQYKSRDVDILQTFPNGTTRLRFRTVPAAGTPATMSALFHAWKVCQEEHRIPFLVLLAALDLDFLCIHPFRDGNGRASRLLLLLGCYHAGLQAGRYVSLERIIEENKEGYYDALERSSAGWHEARHDPWPYIRFVLYTIKTACLELEARVGQMGSPRGAKTQLVEQSLAHLTGTFTLAALERSCPGVSRDMIRKVLKTLRRQGRLSCTGRGPAARWQKEGTWP
jgi:Fic family protein